MKDPITLDHLKTLIEKANNGKPSIVYLCWNYDGRYIITTIKLNQGAELAPSLQLHGISHDWRRHGAAPDGPLSASLCASLSASLYGTFTPNHDPLSYLYDNYWFAFAHMLQLNAEKVS